MAVDQRGTGASSPTECALESRDGRRRLRDQARRQAAVPHHAPRPRRTSRTCASRSASTSSRRSASPTAPPSPRSTRAASRSSTAAVVLDSPTPVDGLRRRSASCARSARRACCARSASRAPATAPSRTPTRRSRRRRAAPAARPPVSPAAARRVRATESMLYELIAASDVEPGLRAGLPAAIASLAKGDATPLLHLDCALRRPPARSASTSPGCSPPTASRAGCRGRRTRRWPAAQTRSRRSCRARDAFAPFAVATILGASPAPLCALWPPTPKPGAATRHDHGARARPLRPRRPAHAAGERPPHRRAVPEREAASPCRASATPSCATTSAVAPTPPWSRSCAASPSRRVARKGGIVAAPYAPATVGALRPTKLPGLAGRTFSAVTVTLTGVGYDTLARLPALPRPAGRLRQVRSTGSNCTTSSGSPACASRARSRTSAPP